MEPIAIATSESDIAYVTNNYVTLGTLVRDRDIEERALLTQMPRASYQIGERLYYATDWWALADEAGGPDGMRALFEMRYREAASDSVDVEDEWQSYLAGLYGVCLYRATPANIVAKAQLIGRLTSLLDAPRSDDPHWCSALRADVDALSTITRPFAECDRDRFGRPTSRDRLIVAPRTAYPDVFRTRSGPI